MIFHSIFPFVGTNRVNTPSVVTSPVRRLPPVLDAVASIDLQAYKNSLIERFGNPNMKDGLARICSESFAKLPKFLIETIQENLAAGGSIDYSALIIVVKLIFFGGDH
ncbi:MAG: mannitol-1-phosphate/altronate dehydrogenase [Neolewinella sp.]